MARLSLLGNVFRNEKVRENLRLVERDSRYYSRKIIQRLQDLILIFIMWVWGLEQLRAEILFLKSIRCYIALIDWNNRAEDFLREGSI